MRREKKNFSNDIAEIGRLKKKKNLNCGKSNAMALCYFIIFLQTVVMANFLLVLISAYQQITFLFTNNHSSYHQFMKVFVKKFVTL